MLIFIELTKILLAEVNTWTVIFQLENTLGNIHLCSSCLRVKNRNKGSLGERIREKCSLLLDTLARDNSNFWNL